MKPKQAPEDFPPDTFLRRCQKCFTFQKAKDPKDQPTDAYYMAKCKRCKSEGYFDYGSIRR